MTHNEKRLHRGWRTVGCPKCFQTLTWKYAVRVIKCNKCGYEASDDDTKSHQAAKQQKTA